MSEHVIGAHKGLPSERGALRGEHPGRSANPVIKVQDVLWLEFENPDLARAEAFAAAFGFTTALRTEVAANMLCRFQFEAAGKDGEPSPEVLLARAAQVITPADAPRKGLLAPISQVVVPLLAAASDGPA